MTMESTHCIFARTVVPRLAMFKTTYFVTLALILFSFARGARATELTVCDGKATSYKIPIYGSFVDLEGTTSEFIIPASTEGMSDMIGGDIAHLTFYISGTYSSWGNPTIELYMGEVEGTTLSSINGPTNFTVVSTSVWDNTGTTIEVEFDTPYTYTGGNLLIGTRVIVASSTDKIPRFFGVSTESNTSMYYYYTYPPLENSQEQFIPKTTFTYSHYSSPKNLTASNLEKTTATLSWTAPTNTETITGYTYQYKKATEGDDAWSAETTVTTTSVSLTGLTPTTEYNFRVKTKYGDNESFFATTSFVTDWTAITTFPWTEDFNNLSPFCPIPIGWNNDEGTTTDDDYKWSYNNYTSGRGATNGTSHDDSKCVCFNSYSNNDGNTNYLKTLPLSLPASPAMHLSFWYKNPAGGDFSVYISTDGGNTHETVLATGLTDVDVWTEIAPISLAAYKGQEVVIVFKGTSNYGNDDAYIYLDDVTVFSNGLELADDANNSAIINDNNGKETNVILTGRTLYKDGAWNTLCLPFNVTIANSPLAGADARALSSASLENKILTLNFTDEDVVTELVAGTPYLIKWASGENLVNPVFSDVVINNTKNDFTSTDGKVSFKGTYANTNFNAENQSILFVGTGNTLYYPKDGAHIGAFRAYFELNDGSEAREIVLNFGEDNEVTGIKTTNSTNYTDSDAWYDMSGRKLSGKPTAKGLYIHGGKKVSIK